MMALRLTHTIKQELELSGGATESVFPRTERWLQKEKRMMVIRLMFTDRTAERYESVMDLLFCETFTHWRTRCFAFYEGTEKPLREVLGTEQMKLYDHFMLRMVQAAWKAEKSNWRSFRAGYMAPWK